MEECNRQGILKIVQQQWIPLALTTPGTSNLLTLLSYGHKMTLMALMADSYVCLAERDVDYDELV